jgi:hypothetical protein
VFVSNTIKLSIMEHEELTQQANRQSGRADKARRARLILLLDAGHTWASIRAKLDCTDSFIDRWGKRFAAERLAGLFSRHAGHLPAKLTPADFVILEATGGLEMPVASALAAAGIAVAIVNPRQLRDFARATGRLAKTDRLDAEVLARFDEAVRPAARPLADQQNPGTRSTGYPSAPVGRDADGGKESPGPSAKAFTL